jgi:hypothetical protein
MEAKVIHTARFNFLNQPESASAYLAIQAYYGMILRRLPDAD